MYSILMSRPSGEFAAQLIAAEKLRRQAELLQETERRLDKLLARFD